MKGTVEMNGFEGIREILVEILDLDAGRITPETYLVRDLGAESIDLLEVAVVLSKRFGIDVRDEDIFLTRFRLHMTEARRKGLEVLPHVSEKYPFLSRERAAEIIDDLPGGPTLKVKDLVRYVAFQCGGK